MRCRGTGRSGPVITAGRPTNDVQAWGMLSRGRAKHLEQALKVLRRGDSEHCDHPGAHSAQD
ncbi:hypothetical protein N658DRAFT_502395 [Parathielavia hyrcaniae]|uniref:Uncharacterized protein n=1 Tax=Parathielavia hyrcaniae TaxID=113614 RepID=A0AAN6PUR7_9PEZI|nr:hypothetical protein N658DRAFT_502399 [Parathielavia hyrcaniae]KAK4095731.1 hypothetical protein N658DRAFT_502395 [Parathielavia hyrcaniae]